MRSHSPCKSPVFFWEIFWTAPGGETNRGLGAIATAYSFSHRSLHRRDDELGALLDAGRPARRHGLGLGVKADRIRPVLVEVAEAGALPAAEGVIGERHRNGEVDADHADVDPAGEVARGVAVAGEDGDAVAV